ncbi:ferritin-like domain-containing protein [Paenibacillus massiliensis]|uniref:ferritin-like domain-containing protein n=1 Tax=Paenibacillus massiliensis TaxID=225917 RepID=UPI001CF789A1|nr:ferritin-like domain-containing protein [Paenibacillus massiliensis]
MPRLILLFIKKFCSYQMLDFHFSALHVRTGQTITGSSNEQYEKVNSYTEGLQRALMGELGAVERYRKIWFGLPAGIYKDTVFGIILDELKHADKYNYLITLNT